MSLAYEPTYDNEPHDKPSKADVEALKAAIKSPNLAVGLAPEILARMGAKVVEEYQLDENSRAKAGWTERNKKAMKAALQVAEEKSYPWPKAANVKYPLITTAAIQFNARAYPAIVDGSSIVRGKVLGSDDGEPQQDPQSGETVMVGQGEKAERADRIGRHMSWQLIDQMDGWEEDTDRLLINVPITGCAMRKTYFDPARGYNCSHMVTADNFVVNYMTRDLDSCPRMTEICTYYPYEVLQYQRAGLWLKVELGDVPDAANDELAPHTFLEQHRLWDLDGDGFPEPYIITVHKETMKVVRIVARFDEDGVEGNARGEVLRIKPVRYYTKYGFIPAPDGSFYDIGFGHLLGAINDTIDSTFNQLLDAGHLQNVGGGWIGAGVSMKGGSVRFSPGEWKRTETTGALLKDSIVPLPTNQPSMVLFQMLGMLVEAAKDITATKDILTGETQGSNQAVGTTLAMIEQGLKVFTAIYKRIHRSLKQEMALLYRLNRLYLKPQEYFNFQDTPGVVAQKDYADDVAVEPVSDPNMVSDMQRMGRAQFLMQSFRGDPNIDQRELNKRVLEAGSIPDIKSLITPPPQGPPPEALLEQAKLENESKKVALAKEAHDLNVAQHELEEKRFELEKATAQANNTNTLAAAMAALAGIGVAPQPKPLKEGETAAPAAPTANPHAAEGFMLIHKLALGEVAQAQAEADQLEPQDQPDGGQAPDLQSGDMGGVAQPPPNGPVAPIPDGQPGQAGPPMDGGPVDGAGPAGQSAPDGGNGLPGVA